MIDRSEASTMLAKVIAYSNCGKPELAREWADKLAVYLASRI